MGENSITWNEIAKANESISTTGIEKKNKDGSVSTKEYAEVNQRVKAFRMVHPSGKILTEIHDWNEQGRIVMKATAMDGNGNVLANAYACEVVGSTFINKTSALENAETSAVGRCLGFCGFGIDASICSYEELANAKANQKVFDEPNMKGSMTDNQYIELTELCSPDVLAKYLELMKVKDADDLSYNQAQAIINKRREGLKNGNQ